MNLFPINEAVRPGDEKHLRCSGFSLVEVTLAIGILGFSAVVILGLLPTGLASSQRSNLVTVGARLAAEVQSELQEVGLASFQTNTTSFDIDGRMVINAQGATVGTTPPVYDVCRTVADCALAPQVSSPLKRIVVQVLNNPGRKTLSRGDTNLPFTVPAGMDESSFEFHVVAP